MLARVTNGFVTRRPTPADAAAVAALGIAQDLDDIGEADMDVDDVVAEWEGADLDRDAWLVHTDAGEPAAYAGLDGDHGRVFTDPRFKGRGLGAELAGLLESRAREKGLTRLLQLAFGGNDAARELFAARGYERDQSYWRMRIAVADAAAPP